jgi:hypothetical protein
MEYVGMPGLNIVRGLVDYNRADGTVRGVPRADIPPDEETGEYVRQAVLETAKTVKDEHLKPRDFRRLLKERLKIEEPELSFFAVPNGRGFDIGIDYDDGDGHFVKGVIWEYVNLEEVPQYVRDQVIAKLRLTML